jgi:hypothetical protein
MKPSQKIINRARKIWAEDSFEWFPLPTSELIGMNLPFCFRGRYIVLAYGTLQSIH